MVKKRIYVTDGEYTWLSSNMPINDIIKHLNTMKAKGATHINFTGTYDDLEPEAYYDRFLTKEEEEIRQQAIERQKMSQVEKELKLLEELKKKYEQ